MYIHIYTYTYIYTYNVKHIQTYAYIYVHMIRKGLEDTEGVEAPQRADEAASARHAGGRDLGELRCSPLRRLRQAHGEATQPLATT